MVNGAVRHSHTRYDAEANALIRWIVFLPGLYLRVLLPVRGNHTDKPNQKAVPLSLCRECFSIVL